jgi:transcription elongation factor Elf1
VPTLTLENPSMADPLPNGMACPQCGHTVLRQWMTRPRPGRLDRVRRCVRCGCQTRTSERVTGRVPDRKHPPK